MLDTDPNVKVEVLELPAAEPVRAVVTEEPPEPERDYQRYKAERQAQIKAQSAPPAESEPKPEPAKADVPATAEAPKPETPAPTDEAAQKASEAAKVLAERSQQSRAEKRKSEIQAEIDWATRRKYDLLREVEELERRRQSATAPAASVTPPTPAPAPADDPEPKLDDPAIADYEDWRAKHELWTARKVAREELAAYRAQEAKAAEERRIAEETRAAETRRQTALSAHQERVRAFAADHPDYDEVLGRATGAPTEEIASTLIESPVGPAMAYHLAQHPDEYQALRALTGREAFRALGKLEAQFEASSEPPPAPPVVKTSSAPAPITPVRGAAVVPESASPSDWRAYRAKRLAQFARQAAR